MFNWTYDDHRQYSSEHLQKADKRRQAEELQREQEQQSWLSRILRRPDDQE